MEIFIKKSFGSATISSIEFILIDLYFEGECDRSTRLKIYCYMAAGGLLWSNWCEYKRKLGIKFGTYARRQYEYAKEYYEIVHNELQCGR